MNDWPETNPSLILRIKDPQNAVAWNELMAIYRPVVYRLARRKGLLHEDAEDLVQGVFLSVAKAIDRWEHGDHQPRFRNWLGKIARNAIVNAITRAKPDRASGKSSVMQTLASLPEDRDTTQALIVECRLEAIRWAAQEIEPSTPTPPGPSSKPSPSKVVRRRKSHRLMDGRSVLSMQRAAESRLDCEKRCSRHPHIGVNFNASIIHLLTTG